MMTNGRASSGSGVEVAKLAPTQEDGGDWADYEKRFSALMAEGRCARRPPVGVASLHSGAKGNGRRPASDGYAASAPARGAALYVDHRSVLWGGREGSGPRS